MVVIFMLLFLPIQKTSLDDGGAREYVAYAPRSQRVYCVLAAVLLNREEQELNGAKEC